MKQLILGIVLIATVAFVARGADGDLFPYPTPPDDMTMLDERCSFLVSHFWERCDLKSAMSAKEKLHNTFGDWVSFMPYAHADTVHLAIENLLSKVTKNDKIVLGLARMAEAWTYSDTTEMFSEEIYLPFAKAVAEHRKISSVDRARFERHVQIIENSSLGSVVKHLDCVKIDGSQLTIDDLRTQIIVLAFSSYDCDACTLSRVRLSADINANALIRAGLLTIAYIEQGEPSDEWKMAAASYPEDWIIAASPDADFYFDLRDSQGIYLLDARHKVLAKNIDIDKLLYILASLRANTRL